MFVGGSLSGLGGTPDFRIAGVLGRLLVSLLVCYDRGYRRLGPCCRKIDVVVDRRSRCRCRGDRRGDCVLDLLFEVEIFRCGRLACSLLQLQCCS